MIELAFDARDGERLSPVALQVASLVTQGVLVDEIPVLRGDLEVGVRRQPVHLVQLLDGIIKLAQVLHVCLLQEEVHVVEYPLRRHPERLVWLLHMGDLAALPHEELSEHEDLRPRELDVPEDNWRGSVGEAGDLELLDDVGLHRRAGQADWVDLQRLARSWATILYLHRHVRQLVALVDELDAEVHLVHGLVTNGHREGLLFDVRLADARVCGRRVEGALVWSGTGSLG